MTGVRTKAGWVQIGEAVSGYAGIGRTVMKIAVQVGPEHGS